MNDRNLTRESLHAAYRAGEQTPDGLLDGLLAWPADSAWIHRLTRAEVQPYLKALVGHTPDTKPLYGLPFAVKDNIDLAGVETTAGCPAFAYTPADSAFVVRQLIDAGAIPLGKTNLDQFATGLVGERTPAEWPAPANPFDPERIVGGSSSGSAVVAARGEVSFALGTDTAGSGRVPACFNNLFGLKPTRGLLSTRGVVPACASLDTISVLALTADDAHAVLAAAAVFDPDSPWSRRYRFAAAGQSYGTPPAAFIFGVPPREQWQTDPEQSGAMDRAISNLDAAGGRALTIDCAPMLDAAELLYGGPWVAERYHAVQALIESRPETLHPVTRQIIAQGREPSALAAFDAQYRLAEYKRLADQAMADVDFMLAPTAVTHPSKAEVAAEPVAVNTRLGRWTNFMNLLDYSALAVPTQLGPSGLPAGVTLFASAFDDLKLLGYARVLEDRLGLALGATGAARSPLPSLAPATDATIDVAVCGAHLDGLALNHQLTERDAVCVEQTSTAPVYRFYALTGDDPPRPALARDHDRGRSIEVEVWRMPAAYLGSFVAAIGAPLGLGRIELRDGRWRVGFICAAGELAGRAGAIEITSFAGWRRWLAAESR